MAANKAMLVRSGVVLVTIALGAGAYALGTSLVNRRVARPASAGGAKPKLTTFTDRQAGIQFKFPATWKPLQNNSAQGLSTDEAAQVRLILGTSQRNPLLKVRVVPLPAEINYSPDMPAQDLALIQQRLDKLVEGPEVNVISKKPVKIKNLLAWNYLYTFRDQATGREGIHSHYFIFDGAKMVALIFQALPQARFASLAPVFDQVVASFNSTRRPAPAASPSASPAP